MASLPVNIKELLDEYNIELDDVRWYLSRQHALRLLEYKDRHTDLCRLICSGRLEADLYRMEERFLAELQEKIDTRQTDESELRKVLAEIDSIKSKR